MKTTLNLNDRVLHLAKRQAARDGITLTRFVEDALRARLADTKNRKRGFRLRLETVKGTTPPNIDVADRNALYGVINWT
ncbi:MAG: hypothetical protein OYH76_01575 [Defluviicoccus sp.]|nr:hypothetical protein [Defluviicoccus sp.]MDE0274554.1 hypothetical protein [Defluviicoccus sp.]